MGLRILIAGAGNIGSRYLQGLLDFPLPLDLYIYDISPSAFDLCKERVGDFRESRHSIKYIIDLKEVPNKIEVAIVTTTADVRVNVIKQQVSENKRKSNQGREEHLCVSNHEKAKSHPFP